MTHLWHQRIGNSNSTDVEEDGDYEKHEKKICDRFNPTILSFNSLRPPRLTISHLSSYEHACTNFMYFPTQIYWSPSPSTPHVINRTRILILSIVTFSVWALIRTISYQIVKSARQCIFRVDHRIFKVNIVKKVVKLIFIFLPSDNIDFGKNIP